MNTILDRWEDFASNLPQHASLSGKFPEDILIKPVQFATAPSVRHADGHCRNHTVAFAEFAHGLSRFREGSKEGVIFLQGTVIDGKRSNNSMHIMSLMAGDVDDGFPISDAIDAIKKADLTAVIVTSHSHGATRTDIKWDDFCKWRDDESPIFSLDHAANYLRDTFKRDAAVIATIGNAERMRTKDGWILRITHAPMDRYRIIALLDEPVDFDTYPNLRAANSDWSLAAVGFAKLLDIAFDKSCKDSSRAYYHPSRPPGSDLHETIYIVGQTVSFSRLVKLGSVFPAPPSEMPGVIKAEAVKSQVRQEPKIMPAVKSTGVINANANPAWAARHARRFEIAAAIAHCAPALLGSPAKQGQGIHLLHCPLNERHSDPSQQDTATYVMNASANNGYGFAIRCMHAGCQDADRLDFLQRLIDDGFLPIAALEDPAFLLPDPNGHLLERVTQEFPLPKNKGKLIYVVR